MSAQSASDPAPQTVPVWWEKTVEYKFVIDCLSEVTHAFPLAGNAEQAWGDLLLKQLQGDEWQFRVIEFKRTRTEIDDEKLKFDSMHTREGRKRTPNRSQPFHKLLEKNHEHLLGLKGYQAHWLIYGDQPEVDKAAHRAPDGRQVPADSQLELCYRQYGADVECRTLSREALLKLPHACHWEMSEYLTALKRARRSEQESSGSEGPSLQPGEPAQAPLSPFEEDPNQPPTEFGRGTKILGVTYTGTVSLLISAEEFFRPKLVFSPDEDSGPQQDTKRTAPDAKSAKVSRPASKGGTTK